MILPVVAIPALNDQHGDHAEGAAARYQADTLRSRLAALSEIVLQGSGDESVAASADGYKSLLRECCCRVGPFDVLSGQADAMTDTVISWLHNGARRAIISIDVSVPTALEDLAAWARQLPASRHRLVAAFRARDLRAGEGGGGLGAALERVMDGLRPIVSCVQIDFEGGYVVAPQMMKELKDLRGKEGHPDFVELVFTRDTDSLNAIVGLEGGSAQWTPEEVGQLHLEFGIDVQCLAGMELSSGVGGGVVSDGFGVRVGADVNAIDAVSAFLACLRTDRPDGLVATVVCDTAGIALGLVYSNSASIRASMTSGRGVYWSRSRGGLWRKGDTSGAWQELRGIAVDCDSDALRFTVWQHGSPPAFCHLNRRNCWDEEKGLGHLERTLTKRKEEAPAGSYTKRLFEDPVLLRNKLVEEAQELAEAETKAHVAEEAADVTYFMMVRCAAAGVKWEDVEKELDTRSLKLKRRPGNAKAERIAQGDRILGAGRKVEVASLI